MSTFQFYMPVCIRFGKSRIGEIGELTAQYGRKAMLVTTPWIDAQRPLFEKVITDMKTSGIAVTLFDEVNPNPTVDMLDRGAALARQNGIDVVVGVGGGSSMDSAKAIAVGASHPGSVWDYVVSTGNRTTERTLPIITVPTTAGTGAHITQGAVITHAQLRRKSAIVGRNLFPRACIVDPDLTATLPRHAWAATGFDSFTHAFESFIHQNHIQPVDQIALKAMCLNVYNMPRVLDDPGNGEARENMSYADTLSGISNANVGTTLPHALAQAVSGYYPRVTHGESLALVYRAVLEFTCPACVERFAQVARIFDPELATATDERAAEKLGELVSAYLGKIGLRPTFETLGLWEADVEPLAEAAMNYTDTYVNPKVPSEDEVRSLYRQCMR